MDSLKTGAAEAAFHEEKINLRHYWHVILERRWLVLTAFISVFNATPVYQATARMQIDRSRTMC